MHHQLALVSIEDKNVENIVTHKNQKQEENSVAENVFINITEEKIISVGEEELVLSVNHFKAQMNGKDVLKLSGKEITQLVEDVEKNLHMKKINSSIFTTSYHLGIKNIEQMSLQNLWLK